MMETQSEYVTLALKRSIYNEWRAHNADVQHRQQLDWAPFDITLE